VAVDHYENFPVATLLCPPAMRAGVTALYHFARTADDIADEGDAPAEARRAQLLQYRQALQRAAAGQAVDGPWAGIFSALAAAIGRHGLPLQLLDDLLDAFTQDTQNPRYADRAQLLDYCRRSANPVGRLLLHLYGVTDADSLAQSDAICSALQLINFWQDLSVDIPRGRFYLPLDRCRALGVDPRQPGVTPETSVLIAENVRMTLGMMQKGSKLPRRVPGRAGWELRLVVQGGLRILDKVRTLGVASVHTRPVLGAGDVPLMLWRAAWM
jgi:squalene synthase HpnC